ncbi:ABC transporter ATP-binding protein [Lacrimispora defluvii]|uniref:ABC transporter ATP-binding protein n=1 Tax=Lacrimispora defluvii TaxID=2719233 RepID=A0ABX1VRA3_9FIRM|nr:ABC transporter ATP-binding protein [Lacrimispora defluvii]NNJ30958.1 ABC transporter ATP-binding protein [Lacrimispora defluvii]
MLEMENIQKTYGDFTLNCSLKLQSGYITGLIGTNGAGKTTLFKSALGLITLDQGEVKIFDKPSSQLSMMERQDMGVVLADSGFSGYLTIQDIARIMKNIYQLFDQDGFLKKCRESGLPLNKRGKDFSAGMKAKVKVLAAMSHEAKLLILDEPTAGLDVLAREELLDSIREYMEPGDRSILISSHISTDLEQLCDDLYLIDHGNIVLHEETDVLLGSYGLLKVTVEQEQKLDKRYILRRKKEPYGYRLLTDKIGFYQESQPEIIIEKGSVDEVITMMIRGERL